MSLTPISLLLREYGPGLIYGKDTIQCFVENVEAIDSKLLFNTFYLNTSYDDDRNEDIEEMRDLNEIRSELKKHYQLMFKSNSEIYPDFCGLITPEKTIATEIMEKVFMPIIETTLQKSPELIVSVIPRLREFETENSGENNWDIPEISSKIIQWVSNALTKELKQENVENILLFWMDFIKLRLKTDDILRLLEVMPTVNNNINIRVKVKELIDKIREDCRELKFNNYFCRTDNQTNIIFNILKCSTSTQSESFDHPRKSASYKGFLYVADISFGLVKIGTGLMGTIPCSIQSKNEKFIDMEPSCMSICDKKLLLKFQNSPLYLIDINTLEVIETISQLNIVNQLVTSYGNEIYLIENNELITYVFDGEIKKINSKKIVKEDNSEIDFQFVQNKSTEIFSEEKHIIIIYKIERSIITYTISKETGVFRKHQNIFGFGSFSYDKDSNLLLLIDYFGKISIFSHSELYKIFKIYDNLILKNEQNSFQRLLCMISLYIGVKTFSNGKLDMNNEYSLLDINELFSLIKLCLSDSNYNQYLESTLFLLLIQYKTRKDFNSSLDFEYIVKLFGLKNIDMVLKTELIISIIKKNEYFHSFENASLCLSELTCDEILRIFSKGFYDNLSFCTAFLTSQFDNILIKASQNSDEYYPFLAYLLYTMNYGVFIENIYSSSAFLKIIPYLEKCNKFVLPILVPLVLYPLETYLSTNYIDSSINDIILPFTTSFLKYSNINDLCEFAEQHRKNRKPKEEQVVIIDETTHPYKNSIKYTRHYDFPEAKYITINFDEKTQTELDHDYLQIFTDKKMENPLTPQMSGKYEKWEKEIKTQSNHLTFKFESDDTINGYGYKATITVHIQKLKPYISPNPYYDYGYFMFELISRKTNNVHNNKLLEFSIQKDKILKPINEKDKISLFESLKQIYPQNISALTNIFNSKNILSNTYSMMKFVVDEQIANKLSYDDFMILTNHPFSINTYSTIEKNEYFSQVAPFLLLHPISHIHPENYSYLTSAITSIDKKDEIISQLYSKIENSINDNFVNATTSLILVLNIGVEQNQRFNDLLKSYFQKFSRVELDVNDKYADYLAERTKIIFHCLLRKYYNTINQIIPYLFELLKLKEINLPTKQIPFLSFFVEIIRCMGDYKEVKLFLKQLMLLLLKFNQPDVMLNILQIIYTYKLKFDVLNLEGLETILSLIGNDWLNEIKDEKNEQKYYNFHSYSIIRAYVLRELISPSSFGDLQIFMDDCNDSKYLGCLLILSQRFMPLHLYQSVRLLENNLIYRIAKMDLLNYYLVDENGINKIIHNFNENGYIYENFSFTPIFTDFIPKQRNEIVTKVMNGLNMKFSSLVRYALSELSVNNEINYEPKLIDNLYIEDNDISYISSLVQNNEVYFLPNLKKKCFSFKPNENLTFGYIQKHSSNTYCFKIDSEMNLSFEDCKINVKSSKITIGFIDRNQMFIQINKIILFPYSKMMIYDDFYPFFISKECPELLDNENVYSFLLNSSKYNSNFSHCYSISSHKLISLRNQSDLSKITSFHLLPIIYTKFNDFIYFEITTQAKTLEIIIINNMDKSYQLYNYKVNKDTIGTIGFFISFKNKFAYLISDNLIIEDSLKLVNFYRSISVILNTEKPQYFSINNGETPFVYNYMQDIELSSLNHSEIYYSPNYTSDLITIPFNNSKTELFSKNNFYTASIERPVALKNINDFEVGLFKYESTNKANIRFINNIVSEKETELSNIYSPTDNLPSEILFDHSITRIRRTIPMFLYPNLYSDEHYQNSVFVNSRKQKYLREMQNKANILLLINRVIINKAQDDNLILKLTFSNFNQSIIGKYSQENELLFNYIINNHTLFDNIIHIVCDSLFNFEIPFNECLITTKSDGSFDIERPFADLIYAKINPESILENKIVFSNFQNDIYKSKDINTQMTFKGDVFNVKTKSSNYLSLMIYPICLSKNNFDFSLQFINYLIDVAKDNKEVLTKLQMEIILPLFKNIFKNDVILFPETYSIWFCKMVKSQLINPNLFKELLNDITLLLDKIEDIDNVILMKSSLIFIIYCIANQTNDIENVYQNFTKVFEIIHSSNNERITSIVNDISFQMMILKENKFTALGKVSELPLPIIDSYYLSSLPSPPKIIKIPKENQIENFSITSSKAKTYMIYFNGSPKDCYKIILEGHTIDENPFKAKEFTINFLNNDQKLNDIFIIKYNDECNVYQGVETKVKDIYQYIYKNCNIDDYRKSFIDAFKFKEIPNIITSNNSFIKFNENQKCIYKYFISIYSSMLLNNQNKYQNYNLNLPEFSIMKQFINERALVKCKHQQRNSYILPSHVNNTNSLSVLCYKFFNFSILIENYVFYQYNPCLNNGQCLIDFIRKMNNTMFISRNSDYLLPNSNLKTQQDLDSFTGFGLILQWCWISFKAPLIKLSRVVIRYIYDGKLIPYDFEDIDPTFSNSNPSDEAISNYIHPYLLQLNAIKAGVHRIFNPNTINSDIPSFPCIYQSIPVNVTQAEKDLFIQQIVDDLSSIYTK